MNLKVPSARNIFHDASIKLAGLYLLVIMLISVVFSITIYQMYTQELRRELQREFVSATRKGQILRKSNPAEIDELFEYLQETRGNVYSDAIIRMRQNLVIINLCILISGGLISYYLARRSLMPIERAHEAQARFTADASHELRTPITAMRTETEVSLADPDLTLADAKLQLESNIEEMEKLTHLSDGLLQLARLNNGDDLPKETVQLQALLNEVASRVEKSAQNKKQTIELPKAGDLDISVNEDTFTQALVTIVDNAIKYSPKKATITITAKKQRSGVRISIADQGSGIPKADLPYIFDRFYRAESSRKKRGAGGYGIGLSIAKAIVEAHGGTITAKNNSAKAKKTGSTFTVTI